MLGCMPGRGIVVCVDQSKVGQLLHRRHIWGPSRADWSLDAFPPPSDPAVRVFPVGQEPNSGNSLGRRVAGVRHSRERLVLGQDIHSDQAVGILQLSQGRAVVRRGAGLGHAIDH